MSPLVEALIVGPICYVLGGVTALRIQHHRLTREVVVQGRSLKVWARKRSAVIVGAFVIVMALLTYQSQRESGTAVHAVEKQNACLTQYANRLYDSLTPRSNASESLQAADARFNDALVSLLKDALTPDASDAARHQDALKLAAAAQHKQAVAEHLSAERARNPYPSPPKKVCP